MGDVITMSNRELNRVEVLQRLVNKRLKQAEAAHLLSLSTRHVKRLVRAYRMDGHQALVSKRRGKPGNHRLLQKVINQALSLIHSHYQDFGPTLACEKLSESHKLKLSVETVRQLMIGAGLWQTRRGKSPCIH
jgi:transposase